jgi:DHA1 family bicyclomycin/chloramphenicol resistance-like MFS transporter
MLQWLKGPRSQPGHAEFITLMAMLMAVQAVGTDAMLPALPAIARDYQLADVNGAQWVVLSYFLGLACGQLFWGFLADRFGRRPILLLGLFGTAVAAALCARSPDFGTLVTWRFINGLIAAAMVASRSLIRDLYSGHDMARIVSMSLLIFFLAPVFAPSLGQLVLLGNSWDRIFLDIAFFALAIAAWTFLRLPETLRDEYRLRLRPAQLADSLRFVLTNRTVNLLTLAQAALSGTFIAYISSVQQIYADVFHRASLMPILFAVSAAAMSAGFYLNARIVARVGMLQVATAAISSVVALSVIHLALAATGHAPLPVFVVLQSTTLAAFALIGPNLGALAMIPMARAAGVAAAVQGFISQVGGALIGAAIAHSFNGTLVPLTLGSLACGVGAWWCLRSADPVGSESLAR